MTDPRSAPRIRSGGGLKIRALLGLFRSRHVRRRPTGGRSAFGGPPLLVTVRPLSGHGTSSLLDPLLPRKRSSMPRRTALHDVAWITLPDGSLRV